MPLRSDRVHLANQPRFAERVNGIVIEHAVVPLMPGRQEAVRLGGHPAHLLALMDAVPHELFGEHMLARPHRLDGGNRMQMQRQGDHHRLDLVIGEEFFVGPVNLDILAGLIFGGPAILLHQPRTNLIRAGARHIAMKRTEHVVRPNVGDGFDLHVLRVVGAQEHAALVSCADHTHPHRISDFGSVAEVKRTEANTTGDSCSHCPREEITPRHRNRVGEVGSSDCLLLFRQVHRESLLRGQHRRLSGERK